MTTGLKRVVSWKQKVANDRGRIGSLINVYLDTIHPVFPLYCERELWVGWRESTFPASSSEYASLIAMCALSVQHAQHGSLFEADESIGDLGAGAQPYLIESIALIMEQQPEVLDLEYIRACGFLALFGIQTGRSSMIHKYLGMYHSACARFSLHDESQWNHSSVEMSVCGLETRRRLYWSMYKLEVHSACVLGHMIRMPENQSNVDYPVGLHHPAFVPGRDGDFENWFAGWNTTTDLYRILEEAIIEFRTRRLRIGVNTGNKPEENIPLHQRLMEIQAGALPQFDRVHDKSTNSGRNRCGFQATNILFTIHMIRMFLAMENPAQMLEAAGTLLDSAKKIPTAYIRACGVRLLQELAGTGLILGTIATRTSTPFTQAQSLVNVQIALAEFLETSAAANGTAVALAARLREQINQINLHLISSNHADDTTDSGERIRDAWNEDIDELVRFGQWSFHTGIIDVHFQPGILMDYDQIPRQAR
jgi:hypothetical protein